jgi:ABC-type bacteriocin/lantibiotic exporter with double-glycine peptidase domain
MIFQETPYSCGAATLCNVAKCYGISINEKTARKMSDTTKSGISGIKMESSLKKLGLKYTYFEFKSQKEALTRLNNALKKGYPVIISVQRDTHWALAISKFSTDNYAIIDSARTKRYKYPIRIQSKKKFIKYWRGSDDGFSGIVVRPWD